MDYQNSSVTQLSSNTSQQNSILHEAISTLAQTSDMIRPLFGPSPSTILLSSTLTSNISLIFSKIPLNHPTTKILSDFISKMETMGDGTTFMAYFTSVLAKHILILVRNGLSSSKINNTLKMLATNIKKMKFENIVHDFTLKTETDCYNIINGAIKNKKLVNILVEALSIVLPRLQDISNLDDIIRVVKMPGGNLHDSYTIKGMLMEGEPVSLCKHATNAQTAIYSCPIEISRTITKGTIVLENADELLNFSKLEEENIRNMVDLLTRNNSVVFCNGKVDALYMDYFNNKQILVFNVQSKHNIRRLQNVVSGSVSPVLRETMENGMATEISVLDECNKKYTKIVNNSANVATIVLRSSLCYVMDENERIVNKAIKFIMHNYKNERIKCIKGSGTFERNLIKEIDDIKTKCEDSSRIVCSAFVDAINEVMIKDDVENVYDGFDVKIKALLYAIDIMCIVLNTDSYYMVRVNEMNVKPKTNKNWDDC